MQNVHDASRLAPRPSSFAAPWLRLAAASAATTAGSAFGATGAAVDVGQTGLWFIVFLLVFMAVLIGGLYVHGRPDGERGPHGDEPAHDDRLPTRMTHHPEENRS